MHLDVGELRSFYYTTQLGRMVQRMVRERLRALWPDIHGQTLVGFGFAAPYLRPFMEERPLTAMATKWKGSSTASASAASATVP